MHNTQILCAVMLDTKGPEIRTGFLKGGKPIQLKEGQEITITTDYSIKGDQEMISMSYNKLAVDLKPRNTILCADGTITLTVLSCDPAAGTVRCRCENTAMLGERKNVSLPGVVVDLPKLTEKDREDILEWAVPNKIDMIALSFVRKGSDLVNVRKVLGPHAKHIQLMSKNQEGVINFDEILRETDSFMVARGDKMMIYKCNLVGKPVVAATQMLESMNKSPRPTRAEATDVANAVLDGTDYVDCPFPLISLLIYLFPSAFFFLSRLQVLLQRSCFQFFFFLVLTFSQSFNLLISVSFFFHYPSKCTRILKHGFF
ncbi:hypothetical protein ACE6H2_003582 [Prunus campanulata]